MDMRAPEISPNSGRHMGVQHPRLFDVVMHQRRYSMRLGSEKNTTPIQRLILRESVHCRFVGYIVVFSRQQAERQVFSMHESSCDPSEQPIYYRIIPDLTDETRQAPCLTSSM